MSVKTRVAVSAIIGSIAAAGCGDRKAGHGGSEGAPGRGPSIDYKELPVVQGDAEFGSGKKGPLRATLCLLAPGTQLLKSVSRCPPIGIMYADKLDVSPRRFAHGFPGVSDRFEWFSLDFRGKFTVSTEGDHNFRLLSDDGSILWIDDHVVIDNDGLHPPLSKEQSIHLTVGQHSIHVLYFQGPRTALALQLFVTPPGAIEKLWSPEL